MANPVTNVRDYCALLSRSKLSSPEEVESIYRKWRDGTGTSDEAVEHFKKHLIAKRLLTEYQAAMLLRGHADGFFLGGYKILDRIGKGQMAGVYRAVHTLGQTVALKILPASKAKNPAIMGRFEREARLLTMIDHPNVIRAFQLGEGSGVHFIVMEYVDGETLEDVLTRRKKLPVTEAVRLMYQGFNGLQHLHEKRMIHRDLKPANLMLTPLSAPTKPDTTWDATLKIVDIGLGRELFDENAAEGQVDTQLTVEGAVLGTPDYLAPEQARDARSADIRADIYSLGCVLYHCLVGTPPFPDTNIMAQMVKHATEKPKPIAAAMADAPHGLQAVLDTLMAKDPNQRYATPAEAAAALKPFLKSNAGVKPAGPDMVPAYRDWLESTGMADLPRESPAPAKASASRSVPVPPPLPPPPAPPPPSRSVPQPRPAATQPRPAPVPPPPLPAAPYAPPPQVYTSPPGYAGAPPGYPPAMPPGYPGQVPPGYPPAMPPGYPGQVPPGYPQPIPGYPQPQEVEVSMVDVEVVSPMMPGAAPGPFPMPETSPETPSTSRLVLAERPLSDFNRRDFTMLAMGGLGVLLTVGSGFGLAQLMRRSKPTAPEPSEPQEKK